MAVLVTSQFGSNMWAVLDKTDKETVIAALMPDVPIQERLKIEKEGYVLVEMTFENSPAYTMGKYKNGRFLPKEGMEKK